MTILGATTHDIPSGVLMLSPGMGFALYLLLGASGGLASFILGMRTGQHRNNHLLKKGTLEVAGGAVVVIPLGFHALHGAPQSAFLTLLAFVAGVGWAKIVHALRNRVTRVVEAVLGESGVDD